MKMAPNSTAEPKAATVAWTRASKAMPVAGPHEPCTAAPGVTTGTPDPGATTGTPTPGHGYHQALLLAHLVVLVAAAVAAVPRIGFPHHMALTGHTGRRGQRESTEEHGESTGEARPAPAGPDTDAPDSAT
ncbi:hypothetical protein SALBM135S_08508 [Streptomyces alboniger]